MSDIRDWVHALTSGGYQPKQHQDGWMSQCPAHDDTDPSLSINEGHGGKVLVHCFSGCSFEEVRGALNLTAPTGSEPRRGPLRVVKEKPPPEPQPLPRGRTLEVYIYQNADGTLTFAVIRRPKPGGGKKFSQWTPVDIEQDLWIPKALEGGRPLYRLPELVASEGVVAVVEGEKCVAACLRAWPDQPVTTWAGGTNAWQQTDWAPLAGREVSLVADGDEPHKKTGRIAGHDCMKALAAHLQGLGCDVWITLPPTDDTDIADWLMSGGPDLAAEIIGKHRKKYEPDEDDLAGPRLVVDNTPSPSDEKAPTAVEELAKNPHYHILGLDGDLVKVHIISAGRAPSHTRAQITQPSTLISLAPLSWWGQFIEHAPLGTSQARRLGDALLRIADKEGQVDTTQTTGRGAVRLDDDRVAYHLGDRVLLDGVERSLDFDDRVWIAEARIPLVESAGRDEMMEIAGAVMRYRWLSDIDGRRLMGWLVTAIVGGALEWRPHLILTAPAATGKSWLLREVVERIMGPLLVRLADATPAAIARLTAMSSLPIAIDEAEPTNEWVIDVLKQLRISSGAEGVRVRADPSGTGVVVQAPRYSALLASTAMPTLNKADATRLTLVRLGAPVHDWPSVARDIRGALKNAEGARARIIRHAEAIADRARELSLEYQDGEMDTREALGSAALTAGWEFWGLDDTFVSSGVGDSQQSDAGDGLLDLLALRVRFAGGTERSVLTALHGTEADRAMLADLYGIKRDGDDVLIMARHKGLAGALKRTRWDGVNLQQLLVQIPGVDLTQHQRYFGPLRSRAVLIPAAVLNDRGITMSPPTTPASPSSSVPPDEEI